MDEITTLFSKYLKSRYEIKSIDNIESYIYILDTLNNHNENSIISVYFEKVTLIDEIFLTLYPNDMGNISVNDLFNLVHKIDLKLIESFNNSLLTFLKKIDIESFGHFNTPNCNEYSRYNFNTNINSIVKKIDVRKNYIVIDSGIYEDFTYHLNFESIKFNKPDLRSIMYCFDNIGQTINLYIETIDSKDICIKADENSFTDSYFMSRINIAFKDKLSLMNIDSFDIDNFKEQFKLIQMYSI